ncbi:MAG: hypothetical protein U0Z26_16460 [Anaerolineales bacterium]
MEPDDSFVVRVGLFFLVIGGGAFLLFVVSDIADKTDFDYLFIAVLLMGIGWSMWRQKPPPPSAGRFAWFKKWSEGNRKKLEERAKKKQEAKKK